MKIFNLFLIMSFLISTAFAESDKEKIFGLLSSLPKVSKAKIKRGNQEIAIDLASTNAKTEIEDFDVIMLEEGVYSTLGDFTAKYVRVRGQGPRKTIITSMNSTSPILVNSTELWDVTVADAQFKIVDLNGLWAVNVEFAGSVLVKPAAMDKSPAFAIRSVFSDITNSNVSTDETLNSHFLTKQNEQYLMPISGDYKKLRDSAANLLAYEDQFDKTDLTLKSRIGYKGLFARGMNYLYQTDKLKPHYDHAKYNQLAKNARETKARGHEYVSMLYWAEADRLSGHSHFDEVLKEITPLTQNLSKDCGCTVEGQGLASNLKTEIEKKLYAKLPITGLPGGCKIQTLHVDVPAGANKMKMIAAARLQNQFDLTAAYKANEMAFQTQVASHKAKNFDNDEETLLGAEAPASNKDYTAVADVDMPGMKKTFSTDVKVTKGKAVDQNISDPIITTIAKKFAANIKAAKAKIASSDLVVKVDGLIAHALYGEEIRQQEYEDIHEAQFGRKESATVAMSSVFAY